MQDRSQMMYLQRFRATATTVVRLTAGDLTLRAAFSHIPFWQTAIDSVNRVVLQVRACVWVGGGVGVRVDWEGEEGVIG